MTIAPLTPSAIALLKLTVECARTLQLNKEKTEVIEFGNNDEVLKVNAYLDSRGQTTKSAYYHLKNIAIIRFLFPVKTWRNLFMPLSPAGWIIVMVSFQRSPLDSCSSSRTLLPGF